MIDRLEIYITRLCAGLALLGGLGLLFATAVTCLSILAKLARRMLDAAFAGPDPAWAWLRPILGEEELVTYGVGFALFAALPWVMIRKGNIKIDLFRPAFGDRVNRALDLAGDVALAAIAYLIMTRQFGLIFRGPRRDEPGFWQLFFTGDWPPLGDRLRATQESQILGIPLWPTWVVAEICVVAFFVTACFCVLRSGRDMLHPTSGAG
ncbi:MAG: TRAP transporter small permease subunit [Pseudomonadota bacterium]